MTIEVETLALTRHFGDVRAAEDVSIRVERGEAFGLLGPNGAGKSTVIRMLTTLLTPTSGTARVCGLDLRENSAGIRSQIGYVPQLISVDGALTGFENLFLIGRLYGIPRRKCKELAASSLEYMGLGGAGGRIARTYSGGMIRRLELAQAVMHRPRVLFMDEPTVGLDPSARKSVWEHIGRMRQDYRITIFLTTHYMDEAEHVCDTLAIMDSGRVVVSGSPADLRKSIGGDGATLDDVFTHYTGHETDTGGSFWEESRERRNARRLG